MVFSGAVKLGDLNDFIAPSQACVVNLAPKAKLDAIEVQVSAPGVSVIRYFSTLCIAVAVQCCTG